MRGRGPWNRAPPRRDTRVPGMPQRHQETGIRARTEHNHLNTPGNLKHLKSVVLGHNRTYLVTTGEARSFVTGRFTQRVNLRLPRWEAVRTACE